MKFKYFSMCLYMCIKLITSQPSVVVEDDAYGLRILFYLTRSGEEKSKAEHDRTYWKKGYVFKNDSDHKK